LHNDSQAIVVWLTLIHMEMHVRTDTIQFTVATETAGNVFSVVEFCRKYALIVWSRGALE